jgi:hypothetical protein
LIRNYLHHLDVRKQVFPLLQFDGEEPLSNKQLISNGLGFAHHKVSPKRF